MTVSCNIFSSILQMDILWLTHSWEQSEFKYKNVSLVILLSCTSLSMPDPKQGFREKITQKIRFPKWQGRVFNLNWKAEDIYCAVSNCPYVIIITLAIFTRQLLLYSILYKMVGFTMVCAKKWQQVLHFSRLSLRYKCNLMNKHSLGLFLVLIFKC